jgi:hypothetical protein
MGTAAGTVNEIGTPLPNADKNHAICHDKLRGNVGQCMKMSGLS